LCQTATPGHVKIQFIVQLYGDQSVSITPESAEMPSFGRGYRTLHHKVDARLRLKQAWNLERKGRGLHHTATAESRIEPALVESIPHS
jgi:hypothetical protein